MNKYKVGKPKKGVCRHVPQSEIWAPRGVTERGRPEGAPGGRPEIAWRARPEGSPGKYPEDAPGGCARRVLGTCP